MGYVGSINNVIECQWVGYVENLSTNGWLWCCSINLPIEVQGLTKVLLNREIEVHGLTMVLLNREIEVQGLAMVFDSRSNFNLALLLAQ